MIKLTDVSKTFNQKPALDHVSAQFPAHQTTVIVGPSGSGKSTLLRSLNLLERPEKGHYQFNHDFNIDFAQPISDRTILKLRQKTGMVFQGYNLFTHLTVIKNIMEGPVKVLHQNKKQAKQNALSLLDKVGLRDKADVYPHNLSGGQAQRIAIARSLAMSPEYILLDEPASALDPELELGVLKVLLQIAKEQQSMIIVTHNMAFAQQVADKIIFLEAGRIKFSGVANDFFTTDNQRIQDFISAMTLHEIK